MYVFNFSAFCYEMRWQIQQTYFPTFLDVRYVKVGGGTAESGKICAAGEL